MRSPAALRKKLLEIVNRAAPFALTESSLLIEINEHARPPLREAELKLLIKQLTDRDALRELKGAFDDDETRWHISEIGRVMLAS